MKLDQRRALLILTLAVAVCAGCAAKPFAPRVVTSGPALTGKAAEDLAAATGIRAVSSVASTDAPSMRDSVLADLRAQGELGQRAAQLLTNGFPARTAAIPVLIQRSSVDGTAALVVVEAWGDVGATLSHRRLWVFSLANGSVLRAASFR